jgi:hypothetical protein
MSAEILKPPRLSEGSPPASDSVAQALGTFQVVRSRVLRWVLRLLPWAILPYVIAVVGARDPMYTSGIVAAALALFVFQFLVQRIPETLGTLWNRNIIAAKPTTVLDDANPIEEALNSTANSLNPAPPEKQYRTFIHDFEGLLNHSGQWAMVVFFALLGFASFPYEAGGLKAFIEDLRGWHSWRLWYELFVEPFTGFILGLVVWRMIIIGVQVWRLGKKFDLTPQPGHPDRCGGLESLGNLCLWNALLVTIPGVYLGGWIILGPSTEYGDFYTPLFSKLLLVPMALAAISFFLPLWSVHQAMVAKRAVLRQQLDQLAQSISHLAREMLDRADELEPEEGEKMAKKLELMQQIYQQNKHYPVWPFNLGILVKFMTSQAVPLLGLTGLGQPILKAITALIAFLSQMQTQ